jgi:deazaflavin-dependent oxidoreductase (nitroreductase family)
MSEEAATTVDAGRPPPRWFLKAFTRLHVALYKMSGGKLFTRLAGDEICMVTMTGAKTGKKRTIPLMYVPYEDGVLLVASQGGAPRNPVWYHNLKAHPEVEILEGGTKRTLRARQLEAEEKAKAWPVCVEHYAPYEDYQKRTTRDIPVFYCEP